ASWAVHTEMEASTHQREKGAVRSTILMACRKRGACGTGWYHQVERQLNQAVSPRLKQFWDMGLGGADFFISAIGPAVEIFGQYEKVLRADGRPVTVEELLDKAGVLASDFALKRLGAGLNGVDPPTRFYVLWRWAYGGSGLDFDEANKLAKSQRAELDELQDRYHLVQRAKETVRLPDFAERLEDRGMQDWISAAVKEERIGELALVDVLHTALYLWRRGGRQRLVEFLGAGGFQSEDHPLWAVAQTLHHVEKDDSSVKAEATALGQMLPVRQSLGREAQRSAARARQLELFD
ncbi:MAG: hypothetical protein ACUVX9_18445, partial [Anaerolineae bacterium]